jgi:hypothetical protein
MLQPGFPVPSRSRRISAPALGLALALGPAFGLAPAALADGSVRWQLSANVPLMCAIIAIRAPAEQSASLAITTTCNAARYRLVLRDDRGEAALQAARSSAGPAVISGGAVIITSNQPGEAVTLITLERPVSAGQLAVTLDPG